MVNYNSSNLVVFNYAKNILGTWYISYSFLVCQLFLIGILVTLFVL